jgi:hypothetical protein
MVANDNDLRVRGKTMNHAFWEGLLRPALLILLWGFAALVVALLSRTLFRLWPDGPIKRFLFKRR